MISLNRDETIETLRKCLNHVECPFEVCGCYLADQHDCKEQLIENVIVLLKEQDQQIENLEYALAITENNLNYYVNGND